MAELKSRLLFEVKADLEPVRPVGWGPYGYRALIGISGGSFEGPRMKGIVDPTGGEWGLARRDGVSTIDVRMTLKTDDGAWICMYYTGILSGEKEVLKRLMQSGDVDPSEYYMRTTPRFETGHEDYAWLNSVIAVGVGRMEPGNIVAYEVHEIL